jgi:phospholipase/carboxylesterase
METLELGTLRVHRVVKEDDSKTVGAPLTIVLCHGFGAPGDDLVNLARSLVVPAGTVLLFPEAPIDLANDPFVLAFGDARAWWNIDIARRQRATTEEHYRELAREVPDGIVEARTALGSVLDAAAGAGPLVLGGFSQGSMLALDLALREPRRRLDGLVLLSCTMLAEPEWTALMPGRAGLPVFQSHGESDPILPHSMAEHLRDTLVTGGLDVTFDSFAGPHTITPRTLQRLSEWLRTKIG